MKTQLRKCQRGVRPRLRHPNESILKSLARSTDNLGELPLGSPRRHIICRTLQIGTQRHNIQASLDWIDSR